MVFLGLYGIFFVLRGGPVERRFLLCFAALALVGLGSMGFHGTMLQSAQASDELPMIYGSLVFVYCLVDRNPSTSHRARWWQLAFAAYAVAFTVGYFAFTDYFTLFIVSYGGLVTLLVVGCIGVAWGEQGSVMHRRLIGSAALFFLGGVFLLWIPEHVILGCAHPLQRFHLHAVWHLAAGLGTYLGVVFLVWDRWLLLGENPLLQFGGGHWLPSIRCAPRE
jgi:dihydroceramidase